MLFCPRNENIAAMLQYRLALLIAQEDSGANDFPIGLEASDSIT
jgi:hypothetical protein